MKLSKIISEIKYSLFQAVVRITHSKDINVQDVSELFRALPGVVTVTQLSHDSDAHTAVMKIKILKYLRSLYLSFLGKVSEVK